jgi:hypothetical protein
VKQLKHPATVIAAIALFVALGGGAWAATTGLISGSKIANNSIAEKKLTKSAVMDLKGTLLTYDANAVNTSSPTPKSLGKILGVTWAAACVTSGTNATLDTWIKTPNGSLNADWIGMESGGGGTSDATSLFNIPAGTFSTLTPFFNVPATTGTTGLQFDFTQIYPAPGQVIVHWEALAGTTPTCHLSIQAIPEVLKAVHGALHRTGHAPAFHYHLPFHGLPKVTG